MYDLWVFLPLHRRTKREVQPEHGNDEQDDQSTLPPSGRWWAKARILCELDMLRDVPTTIGRRLLVVVVGGEGLIRSGGHGG